MTTTPNDPGHTPRDDEQDGMSGAGAEIGMTEDDEGSTFEPEEDPEGHAAP